MRAGVLGTGMVGRAIAGKLQELGHEIVVGTRDPVELMEPTEPDARGNDPFAVWQQPKQEVIRLLTEGFGWKGVLDLGDLSTARATEMYVPLWVAVMMERGPMFNVAVVQ